MMVLVMVRALFCEEATDEERAKQTNRFLRNEKRALGSGTARREKFGRYVVAAGADSEFIICLIIWHQLSVARTQETSAM